MLHTKKPLKNPQVETSHVATTAKNNPFLSATIQKKGNPFLKNEPSKGNPFLGNTASQAPVQGDFQMIYAYMVFFGVSMLFAYQMLKRTSKKTNEKIENETGKVEKPNTENEKPNKKNISKKLENVGATKQEQKSVDEIIPKQETTEKKQEKVQKDKRLSQNNCLLRGIADAAGINPSEEQYAQIRTTLQERRFGNIGEFLNADFNVISIILQGFNLNNHVVIIRGENGVFQEAGNLGGGQQVLLLERINGNHFQVDTQENIEKYKEEKKKEKKVEEREDIMEKKENIVEKKNETEIGKKTKEIRPRKEKYNPHEEKKKKEQKQIEEGTTEKKVAVKEKPKYKKFEGVTKCPKSYSVKGQGGTFVGDEGGCHLHIDIGTQGHFKVGNSKKSRTNIGETTNGYKIECLRECLSALDSYKTVEGFEECEEWLKYHINEYLDQNPSEKEDDTDTEEEN